MIRIGGHKKERKRRKKEMPGLIKDVSLLFKKGHWKNDCKHRKE